MRSRLGIAPARLRPMRLRLIAQKLYAARAKLPWVAGAVGAIALVLLSCSTTNTIVAPPNIPGAEFVGSEACETCHETITRDFRTASHARLQKTRTEIVNKSGGKGSEAKGSETKVSKDMGCELCHGPGSLHVKAGGGRVGIINPRRDPNGCFQCHTNVRSSFQLPHHHPVPEGKMSCVDCHNPHKGDVVKGGGTALIQNVKGGGVAFLSENGTCFQCHVQQRGPFVFHHEATEQGCTTCHSPHGSVNQRMLTERNATLCLKCHFQQQTAAGRIVIGDSDHTNRLPQGTCWSAGCHEAIHGSQVNAHLRY
ncbi:MAG: cytochrome c3 family protein [Chthoniobacterales bacterium]